MQGGLARTISASRLPGLSGLAASGGGPRVRIRLPPAASLERTRHPDGLEVIDAPLPLVERGKETLHLLTHQGVFAVAWPLPAAVLDNALGEPVRAARSFAEVAIDGPCLAAIHAD